MKIVNRQPEKTADVSSARGTAGKELGRLIIMAALFLMGLYYSVGWLTDLAVSRISFETEAKLFQAFTLPGDDKAEQNNRLDPFRPILAKLTAGDEVPPLPYRLILMENDQPNALAFPGGTIALTTGLLDLLTEEIEMAFVLAHELGHYHHRDHLEGIGRALGFQTLLTLILGSTMGAESLGNAIGFAAQRQYSQDREQQADQYGLTLVFRVYGRTQGVDRLFQIIKEKDELPGWAYMFSTHPSPEKRIKALAEYAAKLERKN